VSALPNDVCTSFARSVFGIPLLDLVYLPFQLVISVEVIPCAGLAVKIGSLSSFKLPAFSIASLTS